jgi:hypothetical protein
VGVTNIVSFQVVKENYLWDTPRSRDHMSVFVKFNTDTWRFVVEVLCMAVVQIYLKTALQIYLNTTLEIDWKTTSGIQNKAFLECLIVQLKTMICSMPSAAS